MQNDNRENEVEWGERVYVNSLFFLLNFYVNLKLFIKIKSKKPLYPSNKNLFG